MATPASEVYLTPEAIDDAHQLHQVLTGIAGLLRNHHVADDAEAAHKASLRAMAISLRLVAHLDALAAIRLEHERAERDHRAEAARVHTALPSGVTP